MRTENFSPLNPIKAILTGSPGTEAVICLAIPPEESLFESDSKDASLVQARLDHEKMNQEFEKYGIETFNMRQIIGEQIAKRYSLPFSSREQFLEELTKRANSFHQKYQFAPDFNRLVREMEEVFDQDIQVMGLDPAIAINGVLTNIFDKEGNLKEFDSDIFPAGNFLFWRDTNHVTGNQMGTHRMFFPIRDQEVALAEIGFDALGFNHEPIANGFNKVSIEGGDILPVELNGQLYSLIGSAERTSYEAVKLWFTMHERLFSASGDGIIPMVVQGPTKDTQDQMHLDTFFQQIAPGVLLHCGEITSHRDISILMRKGGDIVKVKPGSATNFAKWIESNAIQAYDMTREEQLRYAANVLVHGSDTKETTVFVTRSDTPEVFEFIKKYTTETVLLQIEELTKFYGGAHCASSELR